MFRFDTLVILLIVAMAIYLVFERGNAAPAEPIHNGFDVIDASEAIRSKPACSFPPVSGPQESNDVVPYEPPARH
jgi:hypothetical protein